MAQDRKVFVGGVPQDLNQDDLYAIFSEYAGVKKAWLQKCRTADDGSGGGNPSPAQNHRGFGFVIFHDAHVIDELLGSGTSRFIVLRNGAKLEVKRALSSNKIGAAQAGEAAAAAAAAAAATGPAQQGQEAYRNANVQVQLASLQRPLQPSAVQARAAGQAQWLSTAETGVRRQQQQQQQQQQEQQQQQQQLPPPGFPGSQQATSLDGTLNAFTATHSAVAFGRGAGGEGHRVPLRDAIVRFYNEHRPEKLNEQKFIDFICSEYEGREAQLDEALRHKYGIGLQLGCSTQHASSGPEVGAMLGRGEHGNSLSPPGLQGLLGTGPRTVVPEGASKHLAGGLGDPPGKPCRVWVGWRTGRGWCGFSSRTRSTGRDLLAWLEDFDTTLNDPEGPDVSWVDQLVGDDA